MFFSLLDSSFCHLNHVISVSLCPLYIPSVPAARLITRLPPFPFRWLWCIILHSRLPPYTSRVFWILLYFRCSCLSVLRFPGLLYFCLSEVSYHISPRHIHRRYSSFSYFRWSPLRAPCYSRVAVTPKMIFSPLLDLSSRQNSSLCIDPLLRRLSFPTHTKCTISIDTIHCVYGGTPLPLLRTAFVLPAIFFASFRPLMVLGRFRLGGGACLLFCRFRSLCQDLFSLELLSTDKQGFCSCFFCPPLMRAWLFGDLASRCVYRS